MATYHNRHSNKSVYDHEFKMWESQADTARSGSGPQAFGQLSDQLLRGKMGPGKHYFFFTSLLNYKGPQAAIAKQVINMGNQAFNISQQEQDYNETMNQILKVISGFKAYEAGCEYDVFKAKLEPLIKSSPSLYAQFSDTFVDGKIDYIKFMALLKILGQDITDIKASLSNLEEHMRNWDSTYKKAFAQVKAAAMEESKDVQDDYLFNLAHRAEIVDKTRQKLENKTSNAEEVMTEALATVKSIRTKNLDKRENVGAIKALITNMIMSGQTSMNANQIKSFLGTRKEEAVILAMSQKLSSWAKSYQKDMDDLVKDIDDAYKERNGYKWAMDNNLRVPGDRTKMYVDSLYRTAASYLNTLLENDNIILQQYSDIEKILDGGNKLNARKNSKSNQFSGLLKRRRLLIIEALKKMPHTGKTWEYIKDLEYFEDENATIINSKTGKEEKFDIRKKEHFYKYIETVHNALNMHKKNNVIDVENVIDRLETIIKTSEANTRKETITVSSETGGALDLNHIMKVWADRVGSSNFREDSIFVGYGVYTGYEAETDELENQLNTQVSALKKASQTYYNLRRQNIYDDIKEMNQKNHRKPLAYDVQTTLQASKNVDMMTAKELANQLGIDDLEKVRDQLKDIFIIEKSDKFSTTYNSFEYGFAGGSLGGGLEKQLQNLSDMMALGGITPFQMDFLMNACMNAGPGMLGYGQKDKLETYLSSMASICMFTSGAQALQAYAQSLLDDVVPQLQTTKIHIFQLGTTYIPLSYILSLMETGLTKCFNKLKEEFSIDGTAGNKVTIYNPVNEQSDKITRLYTNSRGKTFEIGDWEATANAGLSKINLNMAIMGSYLDVMDNINGILNQII